MDEVVALLGRLASKDIRLAIDEGKLNCYAPPGVLTREVADDITRLKPAIVDFLMRRESVEASATAAPHEFPLSVGERTHYLLQKLNLERSHAVAICMKLRQDVDAATLAKAWNRVVDRHAILKTRIVERDGIPFHSLDDRCRSSLVQASLPFDDEQQLIAHFQDRSLEPFDLHEGPLARITLFKWNGNQTGLYILVHHIIFDGFSAAILLRSLFEAYREIMAGTAANDGSAHACAYEAFVAWEEGMLASAEGQRHAAFWSKQLEGGSSSFKLLPDAGRQCEQAEPARVMVASLNTDLGRQVRALCKGSHVQHSAFFLAAFQLLLHKYSNQKDITVVMPVMVRPEKQFAEEIGYFFNIVPLRTSFDHALTLLELMRRVQMAMLDAIFHSSFPFPLMIDRQKGGRSTDFKVFYGYQEFHNLASPEFAAIRDEFGLAPIDGFHQKSEGDYDLALEVFSDGDTFEVHLRSDPTLYPNATINALLEHFKILLGAICNAPERRVAQYAIATERDRQQTVHAWNDTKADFPASRCIHEFFLDQVAAGPNRQAVVDDRGSLSYSELEARTRRLALYLQANGTVPDSIVAVCLDRSRDMMTGIMGAVRAGAAYMPIDPDYPDDRVAYMLEDSKATILLTQAHLRSRLASLATSGVTIVCLDAEWAQVDASAAALEAQGTALRADVRPHHLAYVIYTSGSTGRPKGVLMEHRGLVNRIHWMQKRYGLGRDDVVLQKTPYCFDVSVWEFFWPPMVGASIVFAAPNGHLDAQYLERLMQRTGVTTLHYVPSMLHAFLDNARGQCESVKRIFCSGEALDRQSVDRYKTRFPNGALHNLYGPTEAAIDVTYFDCDGMDYTFVPIGRPIDNTQIHILDDEGNPQPVGVPGELYIAGVNLARGYLNRPELTQERFVANPFKVGERMYRTGDLARWLEDGNIQYLGRIDDQVKIGGVRIETGEIESCLNRHPEIAESAVIARGDVGYKQIIAFYRAVGSTKEQVVRLAHQAMRLHLLESLPDYMVPAAFVSVASIPVTSNGKVDRRALEQIAVGVESTVAYTAPATETEKLLVEIWAQVFKEKGFVIEEAKIGTKDNFFDLGGNSLLATQMLYRIRARLTIELPVKALFEQVTIGQLAQYIDQHEELRQTA